MLKPRKSGSRIFRWTRTALPLLNDGETIIQDKTAWSIGKWRLYIGRLTLTTRRLIFSPVRFPVDPDSYAFKPDRVEVNKADIATIEMRFWPKSLLLLSPFVLIIEIQLVNGDRLLFQTPRVGLWRRALGNWLTGDSSKHG
jgi:hypothetical protein